MCITTNCGKFLKRTEYQTTLSASWEICMQVKEQLLELDMKQQPCSKLEREYVKAVYCHPADLTYMQNTSCKMPGWMKHKLESRLPGEISITSVFDTYDTNLMAESEELKNLLMKVREWKCWLKTQHSETRSWHLVSSLHGKLMGKQWKQCQTLFSWTPKSLQMVIAAMKLKDAYSLEEKLWPT